MKYDIDLGRWSSFILDDLAVVRRREALLIHRVLLGLPYPLRVGLVRPTRLDNSRPAMCANRGMDGIAGVSLG